MPITLVILFIKVGQSKVQHSQGFELRIFAHFPVIISTFLLHVMCRNKSRHIYASSFFTLCTEFMLPAYTPKFAEAARTT